MKIRIRKCIILSIILHFFLVTAVAVPTSRAALVSTQTVIGAVQNNEAHLQVQELLTRDDVRNEMIRLGVDPRMVEKRLAALTPDELHQLQQRINELPAGGGVLEVVGIVFVVLLILEIVGVTNIFSKI